jgi:hypothetical protein
MIEMTRNITRLKITSDLQIKHELAGNKKRYARQHLAYSQGQNIGLPILLYTAILEPYGSKL